MEQRVKLNMTHFSTSGLVKSTLAMVVMPLHLTTSMRCWELESFQMLISWTKQSKMPFPDTLVILQPYYHPPAVPARSTRVSQSGERL